MSEITKDEIQEVLKAIDRSDRYTLAYDHRHENVRARDAGHNTRIVTDILRHTPDE